MLQLFFLCFFFFKQKTAYELRISDWSSDVCSSDLVFDVVLAAHTVCPISVENGIPDDRCARFQVQFRSGIAFVTAAGYVDEYGLAGLATSDFRIEEPRAQGRAVLGDQDIVKQRGGERSEEHTSELQSLMRTSS